MRDASPKEIGGGSQSAYLLGQHVHQFVLRVWPTVGQDALEVVPDTFIGVQFGRVRREGHQMQTARAAEQFLHRIATMDFAVVQQDDQMTRDLAQEMAQEGLHLVALNVVLVEQAVQGAMEAPGAHGDAGDRGDSLMTVAVAHEWGLTDRTPGLADGGDQQEAGFVDKDDVGRQPRGVFFTAGQTDRFHSAMAISSRSTARRSGFWGLHPNWCRSLPT